MSTSLHPRLSGPPPRSTAYCVDCYADGGRVTVATRKFGEDDLCERHYLKLCKEMGVEPDVLTLSEANAAKEMGHTIPIKKVRQASGRRPGSATKPIIRPESVAMRLPTNVLQPESIEGRGGNQSAAVTTFPSDSELAEAAQSLPSQPAQSVAPAGVKDQNPAAPARLQDRSAGDSVDLRGIAGAAIHKTHSSRSVSSGSPAGVLTRAVGMPNRGSRQNGITSEHRNQARQGGETSTKVSAQAEKRVSGNAPARRSTSGRPPLVADDPSRTCAPGPERQHSGSADSSNSTIPNPPLFADVTAALGAQGYLLRDAKLALEQSYQPGDTFDQAFKKAFVIVFKARSNVRRAPISNTSQRPDSSVAPAAEGLRDRAHSPTRPAPSTEAACPQALSAVKLNPSIRKEPTIMAKCKCGCGEDLKSGTARQYKMGHKSNPIDHVKRLCACGCGNPVKNRWPFIKGHNTASFQSAAKAHRERVAQTSAAKPNGHTAPQSLPPVAPANGNGNTSLHAMGDREKVKVVCSVSELSMDRIWTRLTPDEKAQLLFPQEVETPAHA